MGRKSKSTPSEATVSKAAVAYIRVSTDEQAEEGVSLEAQEARLRAYCTAQGLELVAVLCEEGGVSGSVALASRPRGAELLALIAEGKAGHVIAPKLDRLFRDAADTLNETRSWDRQGVALHLLDVGGQAINTASAMGRMFLTMMAGFAELELNLIRERTRTALHHKRDKGEAVSRAPRGLCIVAGRLATDTGSDGLKLYGRARSLRAEGMGYAAIAEQLMAEGFKAERGAKLHASTVHYMLKNPRLEAAQPSAA